MPVQGLDEQALYRSVGRQVVCGSGTAIPASVVDGHELSAVRGASMHRPNAMRNAGANVDDCTGHGLDSRKLRRSPAVGTPDDVHDSRSVERVPPPRMLVVTSCPPMITPAAPDMPITGAGPNSFRRTAPLERIVTLHSGGKQADGHSGVARGQVR
jgi:hypothetical protein